MDERDLGLPGITLHHVTWAPTAERRGAVLLIHGLTANSRTWTRLGPVLASAGFLVIAPDLRGRGLSSKPMHGYNIPQHADDLLSLCDMLRLPSVRVIGHSLGAQIGMYLAALYPERVERLVMIDAGGTFPPDTREALTAALSRLDTVYPSIDAYLSAMSRSPAHPWNGFWQEYYRYDAAVHPDGTATSRVPRGAIDEELRALDFLNLDALPDRVQAPTLIIRATIGLLGQERGQLLTAQAAERLTRGIRGSRLMDIAGANHYTILLSEEVERTIVAFLEDRP